MKYLFFFLLALAVHPGCAQSVLPDTVSGLEVTPYPTCDSVEVTVYDHPHSSGRPVAVSMQFACDEIRKFSPSTADIWCGLLRECRAATFPVLLQSEGYSPRVVQMIFLPF